MAHVDNLRRHFPVLRIGTYLNTGSFGALPDVAVEAMKKSADKWLSEGRRIDTYGQTVKELKGKVKDELAFLLQVPSHSLALTDSTTHGLNLVVAGLNLVRGDEVIVTDAEHPSAWLPVFARMQRDGLELRVLRTQPRDEELTDRLERLMTRRTRLIVTSQVSYSTGQRLPIEKMADIAHHHGAYVLVDGAQGAGVERLNLTESGVDFYALPAQKWLCGPDGIGAVYMHPERMPEVRPTFLGQVTLDSPFALNTSGTYLLKDDAARFEHVGYGHTQLVGFHESLQFLRVDAGWDYVYTRVQGLSGYLMDKLLEMNHVDLITPRDARAGLIHFRIKQVDAAWFQQQAATRSIYVRSMGKSQAVRVSTAFYNNEEEVDRLLNLVQNVHSL